MVLPSGSILRRDCEAGRDQRTGPIGHTPGARDLISIGVASISHKPNHYVAWRRQSFSSFVITGPEASLSQPDRSTFMLALKPGRSSRTGQPFTGALAHRSDTG
jgi:hypothetical protein